MCNWKGTKVTNRPRAKETSLKTHHFEDFGSHEWLDQRQDSIEEGHHIQNVDLIELRRQTFLQIMEELPDGTHTNTCQMRQTDVAHVEEENNASLGSVLLQAKICR